MTEYEINGKEQVVDYDLDNRIIKVDIDNNDVEKYRRLVGILDLESEANVARRVSSREADANQYRYDALGRRVIRQEGTTKTALIWWGNSEKHRRLVGVLDRMSGASEARRVKAREASLNQCAEHKHQAGQTVIQNDIMAHPSRLNSVIARAVDGSKFKLEWYHKNYLDHVYAVSDDDGDILEHYRYTAFGEVQIYNANGNQVATTQIDNHILWNTRRRDEVSGFYMYKYRHYSAELGRWPSRDPIEERGGVNLYGFVGNDGVNAWDRLGLLGIVVGYDANCKAVRSGSGSSGIYKTLKDCRDGITRKDRQNEEQASKPIVPLFDVDACKKRCDKIKPPRGNYGIIKNCKKKCEETGRHRNRNIHNQCPLFEPKVGVKDSKGRLWKRDVLKGERMFHGGLSCYRHEHFQCCYCNKGHVVTKGSYQGTYDYSKIDPVTKEGGWDHFWDDVWPHGGVFGDVDDDKYADHQTTLYF